MVAANILLCIAVNLAGMYTKYLTDRGQRQAFLETHRSMETRQRTQNENNRQEKLLLSGSVLLSCKFFFRITLLKKERLQQMKRYNTKRMYFRFVLKIPSNREHQRVI